MDTVVDDPPDTIRDAGVPVTAPLTMRTTPMRTRVAPTEPMMEPIPERLTYEVITPDDTLKERATLVDPPRLTPAQRIAFICAICFVVFGTIGLAIGSCEERAASTPSTTTAPPLAKKR
jgi:hypothetical protein